MEITIRESDQGHERVVFFNTHMHGYMAASNVFFLLILMQLAIVHTYD